MTSQSQNAPNRLTIVLVIALIVAALTIGALAMILVRGERQPADNIPTPPAATLAPTPLATEQPIKTIEGKWEVVDVQETREGGSQDLSILSDSNGIGSIVEFLGGNSVQTPYGAWLYSIVDSSHLRVDGPLGFRTIYEYSFSGDTLKLKGGVETIILNPYVALDVTPLNLEGTWTLGPDMYGGLCLPEPDVVRFNLDSTLIIGYRGGAQLLGQYSISNDLLNLSVDVGDGAYWKATCRVHLTRTSLGMNSLDIGASEDDRYLRANDNAMPATSTPTLTPEPTKTPTPIEYRTPSPSTVLGLWGRGWGEPVIKLNDDSTAMVYGKGLDESSSYYGTYSLEGSELTITLDNTSSTGVKEMSFSIVKLTDDYLALSGEQVQTIFGEPAILLPKYRP